MGVGGRWVCTGPSSLSDQHHCPTLRAMAIVLCAGVGVEEGEGWRRRLVTGEISGSSLPDSRSATPEGAKDRQGTQWGLCDRLAAGTAGQREECEKRKSTRGVGRESTAERMDG